MFSGHHLGFIGPGGFNLTLTSVQTVQVKGGYLDTGYDGGQPRLDYYFSGADMKYINATTENQEDLAIASTDPTSISALGSATSIAIIQAIKQGNDTVQMIRGAMAMASNANIPEINKYAPTRKALAGVAVQQFDNKPNNKGADIFLSKMSKFIDPESLRQGVATVSAIHELGSQRDPDMQYKAVLANAPSMENIKDAGRAEEFEQAYQIAKDDAIGRIKFKRLLPPQTMHQLGEPIERMKRQYQLSTLFKPVIIGGRFT